MCQERPDLRTKFVLGEVNGKSDLAEAGFLLISLVAGLQLRSFP